MRKLTAIAMLAATLATAAPAFAAPAGGLWQWEQIDVSTMKPMTSQDLSSHIGDWVYASDGSIVGSLDSVHGADKVVLHVSSFFKSGNQLVTVPVKDVGVVGERLVVHGMHFHG